MYGKIFKISKTPTQSGLRKSLWKLKLECEDKKYIEKSMGWISSSNTSEQLELLFSSQETAINYAKRKNIEFTLCKEHYKKIIPKSYAENFIAK